jgi:RHS repeat-associated protein
VSVATDASGQVLSQQEYDPWGRVRSGGIGQTALNYTGQRLDGTGLVYYHARYYDPGLARFISPDSIVPGTSLGAGGALGTIGQEQNSLLTVDFHEGALLSGLNGDNALTLQKGYWFQLSGQDRRQRAREPWGPANPQALNRYAYVLDNPLRYTDPTGHARADDCTGGCGSSSNSSNNNNGGSGASASSTAACPCPVPLPPPYTPTPSPYAPYASAEEYYSHLAGLIDFLLDKANKTDWTTKGAQYTRAGRALQKHANRADSPWAKYRPARGNPESYNSAAYQVVKEILTDPNATWKSTYQEGYGEVLEIRVADGRGLRFSVRGSSGPNGDFEPGDLIALLDP